MNGGWLQFFQAVMQTAKYAGAIVSIVAAVIFILARAKILPKLSQKAAGRILGFSLFIFLVALISPIFERLVLRVHTIDVVLKDVSNATVRQPFRVRYHTSDRGVVAVEGRDGAAELRGVPVGLEKLDIVDIECAGYKLRDPSPFTIDDGKVEVVIVSTEQPPPEDDKKRPDPSILKPAKEELEKPPAVQGKDVTLFYRNLTGKPLDIVLYNYSHEENANPWLMRAKWIDLPANNAELKRSEGFKANTTGHGHYGVWVRDRDGNYTAMRALNLFFAREPLITVENGKDGEPYEITLQTRKPDDATP